MSRSLYSPLYGIPLWIMDLEIANLVAMTAEVMVYLVKISKIFVMQGDIFPRNIPFDGVYRILSGIRAALNNVSFQKNRGCTTD